MMRNPVRVFILLLLCSCTNETGYINYDRWKINDRNGSAYLRGRPKELTTVQYILLEDTTLNTLGQAIDTTLLRFDTEGNLTYQRVVQGSSAQVVEYFYDDEGLALRSVVSQNDGTQYHADSTYAVRKRLDNRTFAAAYYHGTMAYQQDTMRFGGDSSVFLASRPNGHSGYSLTTWYRNFRPVKEEGVDAYGRTGRVYLRDAKDNVDTIRYSNSAEREIFVNNAQGDPLLHYHLMASDTPQMERIQYIYDSHGNWTRRLTWKKEPEPPLALMKNPRNGKFMLAVRTIKY